MDIGLLGVLRTDPLIFFLLAAALVGAISLHEYAHALAADLQGDRMPRAMGRLSLNPARHLDPLGTLCIVLVGFGWGKPVEFRPSALASRRFGAALVSLAGPMMNLALALVAAFPFVAACNADPLCEITRDTSNLGTLPQFFGLFLAINAFLAVFNLIPLPPLDGSRLLTIFLPPHRQNIVFFLDRYGFIILLALVFFGGTRLLEPLIRGVLDFILGLAGA
jgi:Zn-dependent protease